jgi:Uma2 family endonuclease
MSMLLDAPVGEFTTNARTALPERYEVVNGEIVELPPMSDLAAEVATRLNVAVNGYLSSNRIGACSTERLYRIPQPNDRGRNRRPDWAYVSYERWPQNRPWPYTGNARDVVPDIAAEVVSPGDSADELIAKAREYLRGGVRLVWIVYPLVQEIHAYLSGSKQVHVYFAADELDAPEILPGFHTPVGPLFPPVELPPAAPANSDA